MPEPSVYLYHPRQAGDMKAPIGTDQEVLGLVQQRQWGMECLVFYTSKHPAGSESIQVLGFKRSEEYKVASGQTAIKYQPVLVAHWAPIRGFLAHPNVNFRRK